jgi:hypothetical protein
VEHLPSWAKAVIAIESAVILLTLCIKNRHHLRMLIFLFLLKTITIKWRPKDGSSGTEEATHCPVHNPGLRSFREVNNFRQPFTIKFSSDGMLLLLLPPRRCRSSCCRWRTRGWNEAWHSKY